MRWTIDFARSAEKDLRRISKPDRGSIIRFLQDGLAASDNPHEAGVAMVGSAFRGYTRYRVGDYRIIAKVEDATVTIFIVRIGHRREVYRP